MPESTKHPELPEVLGIRLDPKTRYLAELAARASTGGSLSAFALEAIRDKFASVTLRKPSVPEPSYGSGPDDVIEAKPDPDEDLKNAESSVARLADVLWSENPFTRLELRAARLPHLMNDEDKAIWGYVHSNSRYKVARDRGYGFNRELIAAEWENVKQSASAMRKVKSLKGQPKK